MLWSTHKCTNTHMLTSMNTHTHTHTPTHTHTHTHTHTTCECLLRNVCEGRQYTHQSHEHINWVASRIEGQQIIALNALPPWQKMCTSKGLKLSCSRFWMSFTPHCMRWCLEASHVRVRSRDRLSLDTIMADFVRGNKVNFRLSLRTRERCAGSPDYFRLVCGIRAELGRMWLTIKAALRINSANYA